MTDTPTGSESVQLLTSLQLVKTEIVNALEQAINQLDAYSEQGNADNLLSFLEEIQQIRGTFKMLDFRAGERLCEELAETGRMIKNQGVVESTLHAFTQALVYIRRYLDCITDQEPVAPSLLIPVINTVRKERGEKPLPEAYFFLVNLRPQINMPKAQAAAKSIPYRRARQLYQLGLLGLIRKNGQHGPIQLMIRAIRRFEQMSRGTQTWLFWYVVAGALEGLGQEGFAITPPRLLLLRELDRQVRRIQELEQHAFSEKIPDWLLKEFLYLVALAEPETALLQEQHKIFHLGNEIREQQLAKVRAILHGPDNSALASLSQALHEEIQSIKDLIDLFERTGIDEQNFKELTQALSRFADIFDIANLPESARDTRALLARIQKLGVAELQNDLFAVADEIIKIEQGMLALAHSGLDKTALVDPVSLKEARIAAISESMTAIAMVKRAISSYLDSDNDKMHIHNISKSLIDVSGALLFLEQDTACKILLALENFIKKSVLEVTTPPASSKMETFADAVSAVEYYLESLITNTNGDADALKLAIESINGLKG